MKPIKTKLTLAGLATMTTLAFSTSAQATLLAHYAFDSAPALTTDSSGNSRTLTNSGATAAGGVFGGGAAFDGNDYLFRNDAGLGLTSGDFTVAFWYQANSAGSFRTIVGKNNTDFDQGWDASIDVSSLSGNLNDTTFGTVSTTRPGDDTFAFQHVVIQRSGLSNLNLFLDGVLSSTTTISTGSFSSTSNAFAVGTRNVGAGGGLNSGGSSLFFDGLLDELYIYDQALTQTEIDNLIAHNDINGAAADVSLPAPVGLLLGGLFALRLRSKQA